MGPEPAAGNSVENTIEVAAGGPGDGITNHAVHTGGTDDGVSGTTEEGSDGLERSEAPESSVSPEIDEEPEAEGPVELTTKRAVRLESAVRELE